MKKLNNGNDFDHSRDLIKLHRQLEMHQKRVENCLCARKDSIIECVLLDPFWKKRLNRSDSGIDQQSISLENSQRHDNDPVTSILNDQCSMSSVKTIIRLTSLIRIIEQQIRTSKKFESIRAYSTTCSMTRCAPELRIEEEDNINTSWIRSALLSLSIEQERIDKELSFYHKQIFKIENVKMYAFLNDISPNQLRQRINEYYRLKTHLTDLSTKTPCNSIAMVTTIKQLEPIAQTVESYFRLSNEAKLVHEHINRIAHRKNTLQKKRCQLLKILRISSLEKSKRNIVPCLESCNEQQQSLLCSWSINSCLTNQDFVNANLDNLRTNNFKTNEHEMRKDMRRLTQCSHDKVTLPSLGNQDNIHIINPHHDRTLCHKYVNDSINSASETSIGRTCVPGTSPCAHVTVSTFVTNSMLTVQLKSITFAYLTSTNHSQFRVRLVHTDINRSTWSELSSVKDSTEILVVPHACFVTEWDFKSNANLTILLELDNIDNIEESSCSQCFVISMVPSQSPIQQITVPLHTVQEWATVNEHKCSGNSSSSGPSTLSSNPNDDKTKRNALSNQLLSQSSVPTNHYSGIRRSKTYSPNHRVRRNFKNSSLCELFHPMHQFVPPGNSDECTSKESRRLNATSSFKREATFRQPIRQKRRSFDSEPCIIQEPQMSLRPNNEHHLGELLSVVSKLYTIMSSCSSHQNILLEFNRFRRLCPNDIKRLYDLFVDMVFD